MAGNPYDSPYGLGASFRDTQQIIRDLTDRYTQQKAQEREMNMRKAEMDLRGKQITGEQDIQRLTLENQGARDVAETGFKTQEVARNVDIANAGILDRNLAREQSHEFGMSNLGLERDRLALEKQSYQAEAADRQTRLDNDKKMRDGVVRMISTLTLAKLPEKARKSVGDDLNKRLAPLLDAGVPNELIPEVMAGTKDVVQQIFKEKVIDFAKNIKGGYGSMEFNAANKKMIDEYGFEAIPAISIMDEKGVTRVVPITDSNTILQYATSHGDMSKVTGLPALREGETYQGMTYDAKLVNDFFVESGTPKTPGGNNPIPGQVKNPYVSGTREYKRIENDTSSLPNRIQATLTGKSVEFAPIAMEIRTQIGQGYIPSLNLNESDPKYIENLQFIKALAKQQGIKKIVINNSPTDF